jgi:hypothetical protein
VSFTRAHLSRLPTFILGGGKSLDDFTPADCLYMSKVGRIIAVNSSYLKTDLAEVLFFSDRHWWDRHSKILGEHGENFSGRTIFNTAGVRGGKLFSLKADSHDPPHKWSYDPTVVAGASSGERAINLAWHLGSTQIFLCGFDMCLVDGKSHWHDEYTKEASEDHFAHLMRTNFAPHISSMAAYINSHLPSLQVFNLSMNSALTCFPKMAFHDLL